MQKKLDNIDYYNQREYIEKVADFARSNYDSRVGLIKKFIDLKNVSNVVELGCGVGVFSGIHKGYIGLDISKTAIKKLKNAMCCDISKKIPLDAESVSVIVSFTTLEHISNPAKTLEECVRIIKPKGRMVFDGGFNVSRTNPMLHTGKILFLRAMAFFMYTFLNKKDFIFFRIKPDYTKIGNDYDACSQIDPYVMYLWFKKRGFRCLNKKNGIIWRDNFIALEKYENSK